MMRLHAVGLTVLVLAARQASAYTITFDSLTGITNGTQFTNTTEGGYLVALTSGTLLVGTAFGNPTPSVFGRPFGPGTLTITNGGQFTFGSVDLVSLTAPGTAYQFTGLLGGSTIFAQSGTIGNANAFSTYPSALPLTIDTLRLTLTPAAGVSGFNLDNIVVNAVPEPAVLGGLGVAAVLLGRRRTRA